MSTFLLVFFLEATNLLILCLTTSCFMGFIHVVGKVLLTLLSLSHYYYIIMGSLSLSERVECKSVTT